MREHSVKTVRHEQSGGVHEGVWGDGVQAGVLVRGVQEIPRVVAAEGKFSNQAGGGDDGSQDLEREQGDVLLTGE